MVTLIPNGNINMEQAPDRLRFSVISSIPESFHKENFACRHYLKAEQVYHLPLRIDMTVSLDAPTFFVMLGSGRVAFATSSYTNRRIEDIAEPHYKPLIYANHFPLNTPTEISIIYNLKSMQILIGGEQRYYSIKEKYMKSARFTELNTAGFPLRLSAAKRTQVTIHQFNVTESKTDFDIVKHDFMPKPITENIDIPKDAKPTFDAVIAGLPGDIRDKIIEIDTFLRSYKLIKFRRSVEKYGNKITYLASDAGISYTINPSRDVMHHTFGAYLLWNRKVNLGQHNAVPLENALNRLAKIDPEFIDRILSYINECTGCNSNCICAVSYKVQGKTSVACHGKFTFKMALSEFDDVIRLIQAIKL